MSAEKELKKENNALSDDELENAAGGLKLDTMQTVRQGRSVQYVYVEGISPSTGKEKGFSFIAPANKTRDAIEEDLRKSGWK